MTYPTSEVLTQTYNSRGLPYSLSSSTNGTLVSSALYNGLGQVTDLNFYNNTKTTFGYWGVGGGYDATGGYYGKLWEIKVSKVSPATTLLDLQHTWDATGNLTQRVFVGGETENFAYDFLNRLVSTSGAYSYT